MNGMEQANQRLAPWIVSVSALLSLNPYWFWGTSWHLLIAAGVTLLVAVALAWEYRDWPRGLELAGVAILTLFIVYITALPKVGGGHIRWVFVCPTLWALTFMPSHLRVRTLKIFAGLFALSVLPAILLSLYLITGLPITLEAMPYGNRLMAAAGTRYVMLPGALVIEGNSLILFWGGMLGRIAGIYDEPNSVGTVAGLIIPALRCNLRDWRVIVALIAGMLSFSLAFVVLAALAFLLSAVVLRNPLRAVAVIPVLLSGAALFGAANFAAPPGTPTQLVIKQPEKPEPAAPSEVSKVEAPPLGETSKRPEEPERAPTPEAEPGVEVSPPRAAITPAPPVQYTASEARLRPHELDSRSNPSMAALIAEFWASDWRVKLIGLGSDASVVRGSVASTAHRLYTDYGLIGSALFVLGFGSLGLGLWRRSSHSPMVFLFLTLFALSIYQRPVVWMPYTLLLLFGSATNPVDSSDPPS